MAQHFICATCGTQYAASTRPPAACAVCEDERQYVGWAGQQWTTMTALAAGHSVDVREDDGLVALAVEPGFAIPQRPLLIEAAAATILWESISLVTDDAVAAITARGPVSAIAISHPHFYAAMVEWSIALGSVPIYVHEADRAWIARPHPSIIFWSGERYTLAPGLTLVRCGGHFPGSAALHWQDERRPAGALFPGDAAQVTQDRRHVAFMYSYPNMIPLAADATLRMRAALRDLEFADVYGFSWGRNIIGDARAAVDRSFDRHLRALGAASSQQRAA